jgi:hypothetical protein
VDVVAHQHGAHFTEIAIRASREQHEGREHETASAPEHHRSADGATTPAAAGAIAGVRFEPVRPVGVALDPDHRKNDDGRRLTMRIDVTAATHVSRLIGKSDDFTHFNAPLRPGTKPRFGKLN